MLPLLAAAPAAMQAAGQVMPMIQGAAAAPVGLAQAIVNAIPTKYDKENKAEIERLDKLKNMGLLGLTPVERARRERELMAPVRAAQTAASTDQARTLAQMEGGVSGGDLSRLRTESASNLGQAAGQTRSYLDQASEAKKGAQEAELSTRKGIQEQRRTDRINTLFSGIAQMASAGGAKAGLPAGSQNLTAPAGAGPKFDARKSMENMGLAGVPAQHATAVSAILSQPGADQRVKDAAAGVNLDDSATNYLHWLMVDSRANAALGPDQGSWKSSDAAYKTYLGNDITLGQ